MESYTGIIETYFCSLQKIIHKQMKIAGAVRVIKGQEVLPDGSTLEQHGITGGSTVNIIIEPEKEINLTLKLGPKEFTHKVKTSVRVRELKQQLIDDDKVGFMLSEFELIISPGDNDGIAADIPLVDESLPLHLHEVGDNTTMKITGGRVLIELVNEQGKHLFRAFPRNMTIRQMKKKILSDDISLFRKCNECYRKLDDKAPIGNILSNNNVIYYIEDKCFEPDQMIGVVCKILVIGRVGANQGDTALSVKLRVQEQMGFPVRCLNISLFSKIKTIEHQIGIYQIIAS